MVVVDINNYFASVFIVRGFTILTPQVTELFIAPFFLRVQTLVTLELVSF